MIIGLSHALESIESLSVQSLSVVSRLSRLYIQLYPEILLAMGEILKWYPEILLAMGKILKWYPEILLAMGKYSDSTQIPVS